ncbi:hypothetical protein CR513_09022, partial [Mucuna pruriens]
MGQELERKERHDPPRLYNLESGESVVFRLEVVQQTTEKIKLIQEKMKVTQTRQKNYHDKRRKDLEFKEEDHVFLKDISWTRFGKTLKSRKLSPRFIANRESRRRSRERSTKGSPRGDLKKSQNLSLLSEREMTLGLALLKQR